MILSATTLPPHRHPFSGAAKAERPLYFEKSERDRHSHAVLSTAALDDPEPVLFPPDEEKGRKFKPTRSAPAIFSVTLAEPTASTFAPAAPAPTSDGEDENWLPGCADDDASTAIVSTWQNDEADDDVLASRRARLEADRQRAVWDAALQKALDAGEPSTDIDLNGKGLGDVPSSIGDLSKLVSLSEKRKSRRENIQKTQSGPLRTLIRNDSSRLLQRTHSESTLPAAVRASNVEVKLFLAKNNITTDSISHTLFSVASISTLSLRQNKLDRLPPAIGRLVNLEELNLATNRITHLPAEIILLTRLRNLRIQPNPLLRPPPPSLDSMSPTARVLGPLTTHFCVPSLREITTRFLLEDDPETGASRIKGWVIPSDLAPHLFAPFATTLAKPAPFESAQRQPFDPFANICTSPAHPEMARYFVEPAVERMEWVALADITGEGARGKKDIPILHRGCSFRCLNWLEEEQAEQELDGFDPAEMSD